MERINVDGMARLPAFSHAVVAGSTVYASGTLGTRGNGTELVGGGTGPQTTQALRNLEKVLDAAGTRLAQVVKVNVYLSDIDTFTDMNQAYLEVFGDSPPARITVGGAQLALGAAVEIDCIATLDG